jgi:N-acetylglucosaminyldiphosphoundecaprenol N-acetyl-beta-D-mannosaminyltransferase
MLTATLDPHGTGQARRRFRIGTIWIDVLTCADALREIEALVNAKRGGAVYTPNVDHVVIAHSHNALQAAYEHASLALADGMPLVWVAPLLGCRLPERVAGSDLFIPLMKLAARRTWRVYLLGGAPEVAETAATRLAEQFGVNVVGWNSPVIGQDGSDLTGNSLERVRDARPDIVIVALGNPKQELWIYRAGDALGPAVALGLGAVLDFLVGKQKRAPRWIARAGLEWLYRLGHDPGRLWRRYLVRDLRFIRIVVATWWSTRSTTAAEHSQPSGARGPFS